MAHNINTYIGREAAWHKLGTVTGEYLTWESILAHGGLDFEVFKSQLHDGLGRKVAAYGVFRWDKDAKAAGDKERAIFLGAVGDGYKTIQHSTGFEMIDALVASKDGAHYETAGVLGAGEKVWGLADLKFAARVGDDEQKGYLLFSTSHDASMSYSYRMCMTRVVCQNTLSAALGESAKASLTVRHTLNSNSRIIDAHKVLSQMGSDVKRIEDKLNYLAGRKMTREAFTAITDRLFPKTAQVTAASDTTVATSSTRRDNILADILKVYELNDGNAFPEQRGTSYNLLNAITNYTDHARATRGQAGNGRAESAMFGSGDALKTKAFEVILQESSGLATVNRTRGIGYDDPSQSTGSTILDAVCAQHS